ncbi:hypothetical protein [Kitasatospora sp. MAP5-34]|uniref:hypothetical protein n=1 Tax=Kitasatospora sp. MAP5-34 TaxID=3035102 RepID=UPI0024735277|nr:hypothetical protein [Kitasatospora sp. MAP5-34]MDH6580643.1 hypothetical protein [Kitasatospora sp. MAP5-34]
MSERRDRRRLHARARALGVPVEQVGRRPAPSLPVRLLAEPAWPHTALPDRDDTGTIAWQVMQAAPVGCCAVTRARQVLDGGAVVILARHEITCPIWSAR